MSENINHSKLYKKMLKLHGSSYLSLMSIVQGVAFGFLALQVYENFRDYGLVAWILTISTFLIIIFTWNEYVIEIAIFKWVPNLIDASIPFLLSASEIGLVATIKENYQDWYFAFAIFCFFAFIAFYNMSYRAQKSSSENKEAFFALKGYLIPISCFLPIIYAFIMLYFRYYTQYWKWSPYFFLPIIIGVWVYRTKVYIEKLTKCTEKKRKS